MVTGTQVMVMGIPSKYANRFHDWHGVWTFTKLYQSDRPNKDELLPRADGAV
jgi:hypothetical protein